MNRYQDIQIELNKDNRRVLKSTFIPTIERMPGDIYVISDNSDRLDILANQFYNDVTAWPIIASVNNIGNGSLAIPMGMQLRIPDPNMYREILKTIYDFNSLR